MYYFCSISVMVLVQGYQHPACLWNSCPVQVQNHYQSACLRLITGWLASTVVTSSHHRTPSSTTTSQPQTLSTPTTSASVWTRTSPMTWGTWKNQRDDTHPMTLQVEQPVALMVRCPQIHRQGIVFVTATVLHHQAAQFLARRQPLPQSTSAACQIPLLLILSHPSGGSQLVRVSSR